MHKRKNITTNSIRPWFLTVPETAIVLGIGKTKVYELMATEGLPKIKFGSAVRIPVKELEEWLAQREKEDIACVVNQ